MHSKTTGNFLLLSLSEAVRNEILDQSELLHLDLHDKIYEANQAIEFVDFPEIGVMSVVRPFKDGPEIEVATIGNEGVVGLSVASGVNSVNQRAYCQVEGSSHRIPVPSFLLILEKHTELRNLCRLYAATLADHMACNIGCNQVHTVEQRCAKWLLVTQDRMNQEQFVLTQQFLAIMLGVSRTSVNQAASAFASANAISYVRGKLNIIDRPALLVASCCCYQDTKDYFNKVFPAFSQLSNRNLS
ncbi:hypothetical protein BH11CYA1_BH11CYA1_13200 [soil metagenome]